MAEAETKALAAAIIFLCIITLSKLHVTTSKLTGFSLKLVDRNSQLSPFFLGNLTYHERLRAYHKISEARTSFWNSFAACKATIHPNIIRPLVAADGNFFMVQVGIGTPNQGTYLNLDTGSGLIWTQCANCTGCFRQKLPKYNPRHSRSFRKIPPNHSLCRAPDYASVGRECVYNMTYEDGGWTKGVAGWETLNFLDRGRVPETTRNVMFGCTIESHDMSFGPEREISGVLGMSMSYESLISQLNRQVNGTFSYCLFFNVWTRSTNYTYLRFGTDIPRRTRNVQRTQLVQHPHIPDAYALNLRDISIGESRMNFPSDTFAVKSNGSGGCIIDTGTLISNIDRTAYNQIRRVLVDRFQRLRLNQSRNNHFDLCYQMPRNIQTRNVFVPMTFHFEGGASLWVAPENVFLINRRKNHFCVGLKATDGPTILAAVQQQNTRFVYYVNGGVLSFVRENCAVDDNR